MRSRKPLADGPGEVMEADLVISFKVYREKFGSRVSLQLGLISVTLGAKRGYAVLVGSVRPVPDRLSAVRTVWRGIGVAASASRRSAAIHAGGASPSAMIRTSDGPAIESMSTSP